MRTSTTKPEKNLGTFVKGDAISETEDWDDLIADLYASATDDSAAARLPHALARFVGGFEGAMWTFDGRTLAPTDSMIIAQPIEAQRLYADHFHRLDPWMKIATAESNKIFAGSDFIANDELARSEFYNDFSRHTDVFHLIGAKLSVSRADPSSFGIIVLHNRLEGGAFDGTAKHRLGLLLPHVRRAMQLRAEVRRNAVAIQDATIAAMLEAFAMPATVLSSDGKVLHANSAAEVLDASSIGVRLRGGPLGQPIAALFASETAQLQAAIASAGSGGAGGLLLLRTVDSPVLATVTPLPSNLAMKAGLPPGLVLLLLRPTKGPDSSTLCVLARQAFGYTDAEADVAAALAAGMSPAEIAAARQVRISTVRTLLSRAQNKSGTANLRELVSMLATLRP